MQQFPGSTVIDMRSLLRTAPSDLARVFRQCGQQTAIRKLAVVASSTEGSLLCPLFYSFLGFFFFFWHSCINILRFTQAKAPGSRCYRCNLATSQTVHSLCTPSLPGRLCNEGVIGLIILCLPILQLKWSGLFPNTQWQTQVGGGAFSIKDTSFNLG